MAFAKDLTGQRFGRLLVISRNREKQNEILASTKRNKAYWNCLCDCGNRTVVSSNALTNKVNPTSSCGCLRKEIARKQKNIKQNHWEFTDDIAVGYDVNGKSFTVDRDDYELAKGYCWRVNKYGYVVANSRNGTNNTVRLHNLIMGTSDIVDHRNWDKSDNRR